MVADHHNCAATRSGVIGGEDRPAQKRLSSEDREVIAGDKTRAREDTGFFALGGVPHVNVVRETRVRSDSLERSGIFFELSSEVPGKISSKTSQVDPAGDSCGDGIAESY